MMKRLVTSLLWIWLCGLGVAMMPTSSEAQSLLPIPGLPSLSGSGSGADTGSDAGAGVASGNGSTGPASGASTAAVDQTPTAPSSTTNPTDALIDLLRDDTAREALIRELETAAGSETSGAPPDPQPPVPTDEADEGSLVEPVEEDKTVARRIVDATRAVAARSYRNLQNFWLRLQRVPNTIELSFTALENEAVFKELRSLLWLVVAVYGVSLAVRLVSRPFRRRLTGRRSWFRRVFLRIGVSVGDVVLIPLSAVIGVTILLANAPPDIGLSVVQSTFLNAFFAVELSRALGRFVLSPRTPGLRIISLSDGSVASIWRFTIGQIYLLGYGQLLLVPLVDEAVSLFAARAVSSLLGAVSVLMAIGYLFYHRREVADWLRPDANPDGEDGPLRALAERWHWPVVAYLFYLLAVVLTRPGNVLLPLLWSTTQVILALVAGLMITDAINWSLSRRLRVPAILAKRLPLLEERLNQMVPAALRLLRLLIVVGVTSAILSILGLLDVSNLLTSQFGAAAMSRLVSVLLVLLVASVVWLALTSWVDYRLNPFVGSVPTPREITLMTLLRNAGTIAIVIVALMVSLSELGMNIGPLLASAGVLGLAISFGAQRMVEDIITGLFIQFENAMNVGDVVDVGGTVGVVEKLTVRSVTLRDLSGVVHMIPFSSASRISNYMRDYAYHVADMGVAYREDVSEVQRAMQDAFDALREDPEIAAKIIGDLEWFGLNSFGDSALVVRARIKTKPGEQWGIGRSYNSHLKRIFDEREIEIPFPHQTLYFGEDKSGKAPALHLKMERRHRATDTAAAERDGQVPSDTDLEKPARRSQQEEALGSLDDGEPTED